MKKFLIILITGILWCTNIYAEFIELKKCFRSEAYGPANFENKKKAKAKGTLADSWDSWLVTYIYTGELTIENCVQERDRKTILEKGFQVVNLCKWRKTDPSTGGYAETLEKHGIKNKFKKINHYEDHLFSINTNVGSVTRMLIKNDEWNKTLRDFWSWEYGINIDFYKKKGLEDEVKKYQDYLKSDLLRTSEKYENYDYQITSYAGGVVIANRENREVYYYHDSNGRFNGFIINDELIIDLNTSRVEITHEVYVPYEKTYKWGNTYGPVYAQEEDRPDRSKFMVRTIFLCDKKSTNIAGETNIASGTAFFINNKGNLLTNNHVVDGCVQSKINYFEEEYDAKLISTDKNLDLALLKVDLKPKSYLNFSSSMLKKRQPITIAGYPLGKGLSDDLKINDGKISSLKGFENNTNEVTVDIAINPGNSGGPIVDASGNLVAVAVSGMSKDVTEGINFGIKSWAAANFLSVNEIQPNMSQKDTSMDFDKLNQLLEESTVYTFCELKN